MPACSTCGKDLPGEFAFCPFCGAAVTAAPPRAREQRKVVTVLFCDVVGSTALGESTDPEALRALLARYFERMKAVVERHGGTVEKFIGDAVMAVFGVPVVHEDDALRAVRAAAEMRAALPELGVQGRLGVATGEVVTGTEERLATGDAVNVAARLQQAAAPDEILIGDETWRLVRDAAESEAVEPLALKGKSEAVTAHRLVRVHGGEAIARRAAAPMVGRATELRRLRDAFDQAVDDRSCQLFTVLGVAGVGKSRLIAEFLASRDDALVVRARCLPYGEGITYWPVVEILKQLPAVEPDARAAQVLRSLLGDEQLSTSSAEIAWSVRKLLEHVAASRPLICVFDDIHWGEETFLDLLEHVADLSRDAPILLLCIARPELLERRAGWAGGKVNATTVLLEPLAADDAERMIESLAELDDDLRRRIRETAEGNPLFVEQMVAFAQETAGDVAVPPSIQALLAARLDQLDDAERSVLECGAVEGRLFHRGAVEALAPGAQVTDRLSSLVRKELVRPDKPQFPDDEAFRFRHLLIRDAAYDALPKATRAELHERFAEWLEANGHDLVELDEILGHHLEQAHRYRVELGESPDGSLGARAANRLAGSAGRAIDRGDMRAAAQLLERAAVLLPAGGVERARLLPLLGRTLTEVGDWKRADAVLREAIDATGATGDDVGAADAVVALAYLRLHTDPSSSHAKVRRQIEPAIATLERVGDHAGLARAWTLAGMLRLWRGATSEAIGELERAVRHAREGAAVPEPQTLSGLLTAVIVGPMPVESALPYVDEIERGSDHSPRVRLSAALTRAELVAMRGDVAAAREYVDVARRLTEERRVTSTPSFLRTVGEVELAAGDIGAAERSFREFCELLEARGDWGHYVTALPGLADVLHQQGRDGEVLPAVEAAWNYVIEDDIDAQIGLRRVHARLLAREGELERAVRLAREAVTLAAETDYLVEHARALRALADVLELAGDHAGAASSLVDALALYERKGHVVGAGRVRERLAASSARF